MITECSLIKKPVLPFLIFFLYCLLPGGSSAAISASDKNPSFSFTENKGQVSDQYYQPRTDVLFAGSAGSTAFHLRTNGISYQFNEINSWRETADAHTGQKGKIADKGTIYRLDVNWLNCNPSAKIETGVAVGTVNNYYLQCCPAGVTGVESFSEITYKNIYSGVDLKWYQKDGNLKYDYVLAAGADYRQIQLEIKGAEHISIANTGELVLQTPFGSIVEKAPVVLQQNKTLKSGWVINGNVLSFKIEGLDPSQPYIIDPVVVLRAWGTYLGGSADDRIYDSFAEPSGEIFVTGTTLSNTNIATVGSYQVNYAGGGPFIGDAFLAKFNASGVRLWCTYYGGSAEDVGFSVTKDGFNNSYVAGSSASSAVIASAGAHQVSFAGGLDAFLVKFNASGIRQWGTYYGSPFDDNGLSVVCDLAGNVFMAGSASQDAGNAIATPGSHQTACGGSVDGFLVKFNSAGVRQWGTYYGGAGDENVRCCFDPAGAIYICGYTSVATGTAIATVTSHQPVFGGGFSDAFLAKFDLNGTRLWATYYGGTGRELAYSCLVDTVTGHVYMLGASDSNSGTAVATPGSHQPAFGGGTSDGFIAKFDAAGVRQWGTYYGGANYDAIIYAEIDKNGNVYAPGNTTSGTGTVMATTVSYQPVYGGGTSDAFLAIFNPSGQRQSATYYGGATEDYGYCVAVDTLGGIYLAGSTDSGTGTVISSGGSHQPVFGGGLYDAYLVKFNACVPPVLTVNSGSICSGNSFSMVASGANTYTFSGGSAIVSPTVNTTYSVTGTSTAGCTSSVAAISSVTVFPSPSLTITGSPSLVCIGSTATLTANGAATFSWNSGSSASILVVSPTVTTTYSLTGTNANGCSGKKTYTQLISACTAIAQFEKESSVLLVYPNPSLENLVVSSEAIIEELSIFNAYGQLVYTKSNVNLISVQVTVSEFPKGVYLVCVKLLGDSSSSCKIIKE